jgi:hypothetical protein
VKLTAEEQKAAAERRAGDQERRCRSRQEVALFGAIWISAPVAIKSPRCRTSRTSKGRRVRATKKVVARPHRDFAALSLPDDDVKDLKSCTVGDCELKMSAEALGRLRRVDWTKPDAKAQIERLVRTMAVDYVNGYREEKQPPGGMPATGSTRRSSRTSSAAPERDAGAGEYVPDMRHYLLEFPNRPRPTTSFFTGKRPSSVSSRPSRQPRGHSGRHGRDDRRVKQLYSSHCFWTALELRALVPDPSRGPGFWFVNVNRSRSDGLSGFVGTMIRGKVRTSARKGLDAGLVATRKKLESH